MRCLAQRWRWFGYCVFTASCSATAPWGTSGFVWGPRGDCDCSSPGVWGRDLLQSAVDPSWLGGKAGRAACAEVMEKIGL